MTAIEQQPAPADSQPLQPQPGRDGLIFTPVNFRFLPLVFTLARGVAEPGELPRVKRAARADSRSTGFSPCGPHRQPSVTWEVMGILSSICLVFSQGRSYVGLIMCSPFSMGHLYLFGYLFGCYVGRLLVNHGRHTYMCYDHIGLNC